MKSSYLNVKFNSHLLRTLRLGFEEMCYPSPARIQPIDCHLSAGELFMAQETQARCTLLLIIGLNLDLSKGRVLNPLIALNRRLGKRIYLWGRSIASPFLGYWGSFLRGSPTICVALVCSLRGHGMIDE